MKIKNLHKWNISPKKAIALQRELQKRVILKSPLTPLFQRGEGGILKIETIAGADMAIDDDCGIGFAGVIVYSFPYKRGQSPFQEGDCPLLEIERQFAIVPLTFPYIPGLLAFRESPVLIEAFKKLKIEPDVIMFDGQGIAHPRGLGIASHMGLFLEKPTIGCAKSRLVGEYEQPGPNVGDWSPLFYPQITQITQKKNNLCNRRNLRIVLKSADHVVGAVLRTRKNVKPIFVSPGHKIDLETSIEVVLACLDKTRVPKPTREADHYVAKLKKR